MLLRSNFSSFPHYYIYIFLTSGVKLHIHLLNVVVQFIVFLTLSTLICRSTDISKCFSESLGIRDNRSRLYLFFFTYFKTVVSITALAETVLYGRGLPCKEIKSQNQLHCNLWAIHLGLHINKMHTHTKKNGYLTILVQSVLCHQHELNCLL